jgi:hypothetical protein
MDLQVTQVLSVCNLNKIIKSRVQNMRAREFIREFPINVPVTINIPLADVLKNISDKEIVNPGVRYGDDGDSKWSPPLQQHLDTVKDSVGPSETDPTHISPADEYHEPSLELENSSDTPTQSKKIKTSILGRLPSMLG